MASFVQGTSGFSTASGTSIGVAFVSNVTIGNLILAFCGHATALSPTFSVSDSQLNAYTAATALASNSTNKAQMFWAKAGSTGACTVTFARTGAATADERILSIAEFAPAAAWPANPVDAANTATGTTANPSVTVGMTAGAPVLAACVTTTGTTTAGSGFLSVAAPDGNESEYKLAPASGAVAITDAAADTWSLAAASFTEGGAVVLLPNLIMAPARR